MNRSAAVRAGVLAGLAGFATFLVIHHLWIVPIWFIAPPGALIAAAGGAAAGAAYGELLPHLPHRPWAAVGVAGAAVVILLPAVVVAELSGPIFAMEEGGGGSLLVPVPEAATSIVVGLLALPVAAGASLGWLVGGRRRAAMTTALAALLLAVGPGHNIPLLGGTPAVAKELGILAVVLAVSSVVLVGSHARLVRLAAPDHHGSPAVRRMLGHGRTHVE